MPDFRMRMEFWLTVVMAFLVGAFFTIVFPPTHLCHSKWFYMYVLLGNMVGVIWSYFRFRDAYYPKSKENDDV
jgi:hypothetical protein